MVKRELEGRHGRGEEGSPRTREVKIGCAFTQTKFDDEGWPVRDPDSTPYLATFADAQRFGELLLAEALRRGLRAAGRVVIIGDGASWIWNLAEHRFPDSLTPAIEIVELYHARQHLATAARARLRSSPRRQRWVAEMLPVLDRGAVSQIIEAIGNLSPTTAGQRKDVEREVAYFATNAGRMTYREFRAAGLFVGSGVVEAGCRSLVGLRLKVSGARWTVSGASAIACLRYFKASGRWEHLWDYVSLTQTSSA